MAIRALGFPFQVAAYRAPEFQVKVTPPADEIVRGTPASVSAEVSYFFGGPVANAPVQWNVLAETVSLRAGLGRALPVRRQR